MSTTTGARTATNDPKVFHFTIAERAARGKAVRQEIPRRVHAAWEAPPNRADPIALLEEQGASRVPDLVPIRYGRMLVSPFTFYRGAAYVMAADLAVGPRTGLHVQLCGDAHLSNFGAFAAPDRRMIIGVNDFDETLPGPFEWDLKRLVASFAVAGRDRGFSTRQRRTVNVAATRAYRDAMRELASLRTLDVWYSRMEIEPIMSMVREFGTEAQVATFEKNVAKARTKDNLRAFDKLTVMVDGIPKIVADPPLIVPIEDLSAGLDAQQIEEFARTVIRSYRRTLQGDRRFMIERFNYAHAARKVVGVGSVGTRAWIVLMLGRDQTDPLFLQIKEAQASVLEPFLGKSQFAQHGQRVVEGQRLMQAASDIMLGWQRITPPGTDQPLDFYVRQLWDQKFSAIVENMDPGALVFYAQVCGQTLARAHARSGDSVAIASYMGSGDAFDLALADFAEVYADQNERDYEQLTAAVESGRITAQTGL
jgi:uncharacterized protein (DUF2252 family)